jgi:hypothetical protein
MRRRGLEKSGSEKEQVVGCCEHVINLRIPLFVGRSLIS